MTKTVYVTAHKRIAAREFEELKAEKTEQLWNEILDHWLPAALDGVLVGAVINGEWD